MPRAQHEGYRIVCGVDFTPESREAVREAERLSKRVVQGELHFVHALEHTDESGDSSEAQNMASCAIERLEDYVQGVLFDMNVSLSDLRAVFHVRFQDAQGALESVAGEEGADVIIVGASARSRLSQWWHRSGVRRFMQRAPVPVLVAHARKGEAYSSVQEANEGGSGVYSAVPRRPSVPPATTPAMEGDSTSSLYCMYESRASQPPPPPANDTELDLPTQESLRRWG